jgi:hypothetical protein
MMWLMVFAAFSVLLAATGFWAHRSARRSRFIEWQTIVAQLEPVPFEGLERVALDHLKPVGNQLQLETDEMWSLVGGWEGLRKMRHNANLLIQLAAYIQIWNYDEAIIVSERIRQDALMMKRAIRRIQMHNFWIYRLRVPFYVHQAASSYYLMTRRLLALYQTNQYMLYPVLAEAL